MQYRSQTIPTLCAGTLQSNLSAPTIPHNLSLAAITQSSLPPLQSTPITAIMSNPFETDSGTEQFTSYESELSLVFADLTQKLDQATETPAGEERKTLLRTAERALSEAKELLEQMNLSKSSIPTNLRSKINARYRNASSDLDAHTRRHKTLSRPAANQSDNERAQLFGERYTDDPNPRDAQLEQRQQLLSGTERLGRSGDRLRESQRIALETEQIGAGTLADLHQQRSVIENTQRNLLQSEGYVDRSVKTLRGMARR